MATDQVQRTLYVDCDCPAFPMLQRLVSILPVSSPRRLLDKMSADSRARRNPRASDYMVRLVHDAHGQESAAAIESIRSPRDLDIDKLRHADRIVLLWRDGNGTGWLPVERRVFRHKRHGSAVLVLNGRRREFDLRPNVWRSFLLRRAIEKSLVPEAMMCLLFCMTTPWLAIADAVRGRR